jgi:predicted dehydrogenase
VSVRLAAGAAGGKAPGGVRWAGRGRDGGAPDSGAPDSGATSFAGAFERQLADFVAAARERREPRVPGREGRRAVALVEACYARRRPLELPWDEPPELALWREPGERPETRERRKGRTA